MGILLLTKSMAAIMIGFMLSTILGLIIIPIIKKKKLGQRISSYVGEVHKKKEGTPTMGGLIFVLSTLLAMTGLIVTHKIELTTNLLIVLFVFVGYALIGFLDDFLSLKHKKNEGLSTYQKLFLQLIIAIIFFYLYMQNGGSTSLHIAKLGFKVDMGMFYGLFILFVLVGASNAVNLTDGLDGLAGGLSVIAFLAFSLISMVVGDVEIGIFTFILMGSVLGFLIYNTHPAKIFMGDTGRTLSVIIQVIWMYLFKKKLFLMTPLHHHFEKLGWCEQDIVKLFWVVGLILTMAGIYYGVWL